MLITALMFVDMLITAIVNAIGWLHVPLTARSSLMAGV
jgi:hypothetical protein